MLFLSRFVLARVWCLVVRWKAVFFLGKYSFYLLGWRVCNPSMNPAWSRHKQSSLNFAGLHGVLRQKQNLSTATERESQLQHFSSDCVTNTNTVCLLASAFWGGTVGRHYPLVRRIRNAYVRVHVWDIQKTPWRIFLLHETKPLLAHVMV
jgi:hypothetical protein